jgi:heme/copper-type cytochrome/quinol oxidase subunit 2
MSNGLRKCLLVVVAIIMAAGITYYPWTLMDRWTGTASTVYGMSSLLWAPAALIIGIVAGFCFAFAFWPRKSKEPRPGTGSSSGIEV